VTPLAETAPSKSASTGGSGTSPSFRTLARLSDVIAGY
jgi:hypothetical protein